MHERNQTVIIEFFLLGFGKLHDLRILLFLFFLTIHIMALAGNLLIILLVVVNRNLHSPMYVLLSQLSLSEILFTGNLVPNMLWLILAGGGKVSVARCITQFYFLGVPTIAQCLLLAAMSFDRHVAICRPLHYSVITTPALQARMIISCWLVGFTLTFIIYVFLHRLEFCGPSTINHFFCDIGPLVDLSCSDITTVQLVTSFVSFPIIISPFVFIKATYISILLAILKIPSISGRKKAFSTCSSHLMVVCLYYGTLMSIYIFPSSNASVDMNKCLSALYALVTPLFNPLIYGLRNQEIRVSIRRHIQTCRNYLVK
ncbi:olfactory receptor 6N1-like [Hyperolius riggenbachi]|uniref:olfactory receptor 6N1-like n=1 Tax=Hyperolius riggenbachi TaxID=752182 RepID=UPI0035A309C0